MSGCNATWFNICYQWLMVRFKRAGHMGRRLSQLFFSFDKDKFYYNLTYLLQYDILQQYVTYLLQYDILYMVAIYHIAVDMSNCSKICPCKMKNVLDKRSSSGKYATYCCNMSYRSRYVTYCCNMSYCSRYVTYCCNMSYCSRYVKL